MVVLLLFLFSPTLWGGVIVCRKDKRYKLVMAGLVPA
jgi:hypothetical protein